MEWDQLLFYHGIKKFKSLKAKFTPPCPYYLYQISSEEKRLKDLGRLILGEELRFQTSGKVIEIRSEKMLFPEELRLLKNEAESKHTIHYLFAYVFLLKKHKFFHGKSFANVTNFSDTHRFLLKKYPGLSRDRKQIRNFFQGLKLNDPKHHLFLTDLIGNTIFENESLLPQKSLLSNLIPSPNKQSKPKSEFKTQFDMDSADLLVTDKKKIEEYTLGHNFEKIETLEEFDGNWRDLDGSDNAEEEAEALSELYLKHLIRSDDPVHTTVSSDVGSGTVLEVADKDQNITKFKYDEWDFKQKKYKLKFCSVEEERFIDSKLYFAEEVFSRHRFTLLHLKHKLYALIQERVQKRRVQNGDNVDFDGVVDRYADLIARVTPSELIYVRSQREIANMTLFFLMDISLSTDSWVNGKRILDVERESLLLFSNALENLEIPFEIGAFYSRTRNQCKFLRIKSSSDSLQMTKDRLGALEPIGYTRIGPALRHSGVMLDKVKTRQKWIILFTDAHPNDYDRYEGKYGTEDINQAVKELKRRGILVHTLAIGRDEKPVIPRMMREASYQMLADPKGIIESLHRFFAKAINSR